MRGRGLGSFLCMWVSSFSNTICWRDYPFPIVNSQHSCRRSFDHVCMGLFLVLYSVPGPDFYIPCHPAGHSLSPLCTSSIFIFVGDWELLHFEAFLDDQGQQIVWVWNNAYKVLVYFRSVICKSYGWFHATNFTDKSRHVLLQFPGSSCAAYGSIPRHHSEYHGVGSSTYRGWRSHHSSSLPPPVHLKSYIETS